MVLSFKLEACATAPDTVVMKMQSVLDLCNACNSDTAACWWICPGSICPFRNAFEGHSDEDHRRVRKASQLDVVARAQSADSADVELLLEPARSEEGGEIAGLRGSRRSNSIARWRMGGAHPTRTARRYGPARCQLVYGPRSS